MEMLAGSIDFYHIYEVREIAKLLAKSLLIYSWIGGINCSIFSQTVICVFHFATM